MFNLVTHKIPKTLLFSSPHFKITFYSSNFSLTPTTPRHKIAFFLLISKILPQKFPKPIKNFNLNIQITPYTLSLLRVSLNQDSNSEEIKRQFNRKKVNLLSKLLKIYQENPIVLVLFSCPPLFLTETLLEKIVESDGDTDGIEEDDGGDDSEEPIRTVAGSRSHGHHHGLH